MSSDPRNPSTSDSSDSRGPILGGESDAMTRRIKEVIDAAESVSAFARQSGLGESLLRKYVAGATPRADYLVAIADAGGVTVDWLATGRGAKFRSDASAPRRLNDDQVERLQSAFQAFLDASVEDQDVFQAMTAFVHGYGTRFKAIPGLPRLSLHDMQSAWFPQQRSQQDITADEAAMLADLRRCNTDQKRTVRALLDALVRPGFSAWMKVGELITKTATAFDKDR